ncbi:MAG: hypothetical protein B6I24_02615 [Bacteroidetes bacterium 4572_128]|nr:MAG: hypothetical protein B6I24_02615 [Bacteroidetes bacterium 4572_128]
MQDFETKKLAIKDINFMGSNLMFLHLTNERIILIPLYKFPEIKTLNEQEKTDFEIIDKTFLSFLSIDEIYNVKDLLGV